MTIGDHTPTPSPGERRKVRFGAARQRVIVVAAAVLAIVGLVVFAAQ
jgi:hypothetical protein